MSYEYSCSGGIRITPPLSTSQREEFLAFRDSLNDPEGPNDRYCPFELYSDLDLIHCAGTLDESPIDWVSYLIDKFFAPRGYTLDGDVVVEGEDFDDRTVIAVHDNKVEEFVLPSVEDVIHNTRALREAKTVLASDLPDGDKLSRIVGLIGLESSGFEL